MFSLPRSSLLVLKLFADWQLRRVIRELRRHGAAGQALVLGAILDADVRRDLEQRLAEDALEGGEAPVERFSFPAAERGRLAALSWGAATLARLLSAWSGWGAPTTSLRRIAAASAGAAVIATVGWQRHRGRLLDTVLEVSRFAITEVASDGSRPTLLWRDAGWLLNRPRRRRFDVLTPDGRSGVAVHYDRAGFYRATELVLEYGEFKSSDPAP